MGKLCGSLGHYLPFQNAFQSQQPMLAPSFLPVPRAPEIGLCMNYRVGDPPRSRELVWMLWFLK